MNLNLFDILQNILNESIDQNSVANAIQNKRVVMFTYNDEKPNPHIGKRWVEPYALVDMDGHGKLAIRGYEYTGDSRRGLPPTGTPTNWRLFRLDRITSWQPTTSKFTIDRAGYNKLGDKQYLVICQVQMDDNDNMIQQNIQNMNQTNQQLNVDTFGRKINRKKPNNVGPVNQDDNQILQSLNNQSGPTPTSQIAKDRKSVWKKTRDLEYRRNKREQEKAEKLRKQEFGDEEEEMMNMFDKGKLF